MNEGPVGGERPRPEEPVDLTSLSRYGATTAPRAEAATWAPVAATTIGSVHVRDQIPAQDAVLTWAEGGRTVIAVADGHGHHAHFRSDTGAALAVVAAVEELRAGADLILDLPDPEAGVREVAAAIVRTWVAKVGEHLTAHPFDVHEEAANAADPLRPYGTTVLAAAALEDLVVFLQIGDGDAVLVTADGAARRPVPPHPELDGVRTHSLCQPDPLAALRIAVVEARPLDGSPAAALAYLCTDGFGGARVESDWWSQTGTQLLDFSRRRGLAWVREQLSSWIEEPALVGGDDTTLALMVRDGV